MVVYSIEKIIETTTLVVIGVCVELTKHMQYPINEKSVIRVVVNGFSARISLLL